MIGLGRRTVSIIGCSLVLTYVSAFCNIEVEAQTISEDRLNAVLSGMGTKVAQPDFDAVLTGMGLRTKEPDLDEVLAAMGTKSEGKSFEFDGIIASMSVSKSLNYLDNLYSSSNISGYPVLNYFGDTKSGSGYVSPLISGKAVLPVRGRVTSRFGFRPSFGKMHKGIDIALQVGDTIVAAMDGKVERVSIDPHGYGIFVCLGHANGLKTRYAHLCSSLVTPGMYVSAGEAIALGGNTGNSTGPHLHFETRVNDTALDPSRFFDFSTPVNIRGFRNLATLEAKNPKFGTNSLDPMNSAGGVSPVYPGTMGKGTYVVKAGDTIASVAKKNGISVMSLCRLNMLSSSDNLQPGRMLKIR